MFFFSRRAKFPKIMARSPREQLVRSLLLIIVIAATAWGFWKNSERQIDRLNTRGSVWDEAQVLSDSDKTRLRDIVKLFKDRYGLAVLIHVRREKIVAPSQDDKTIFIGAVPSSGETCIMVPPLVRRALPQGFLENLEKDPLGLAIQAEACEYGLTETLHQIWVALDSTK